MILRAMKAERTAGLLDDPLWDEGLMIQLPRPVLELLIRYILEAGVDKNAFIHRLQSIKGPEIQRSAMTIAQELRHEGRQEGRQEGRREGLRSMILETLEIRFGNLPGGILESVSEISDDSRLHELFRAAVKAGSVEEFSLSL